MESQAGGDARRQHRTISYSLQEETICEPQQKICKQVLFWLHLDSSCCLCLFQGLSWKFILGALVVALGSLVTSVVLTARNWDPQQEALWMSSSPPLPPSSTSSSSSCAGAEHCLLVLFSHLRRGFFFFYCKETKRNATEDALKPEVVFCVSFYVVETCLSKRCKVFMILMTVQHRVNSQHRQRFPADG